jgi:hypothetical protein
MDIKLSNAIDDLYNRRKQCEIEAWTEVETLYPLMVQELFPLSNIDLSFGRLDINTYIDSADKGSTMCLSLARMDDYAQKFAMVLEYYLAHREDIPKVLAAGYKGSPSKGLPRLVPNWELALMGILTRLMSGEPIARNPTLPQG